MEAGIQQVDKGRELADSAGNAMKEINSRFRQAGRTDEIESRNK